MKLNRTATVFISIAALSAAHASAYVVSFPETPHAPVCVQPERDTGLEAIWVVFDMSEIGSLTVDGIADPSATVSRFSNLGGGYAQQIPAQYSDGKLTIPDPDGDMGYIVTDGDRNYCFWIVDYSWHTAILNSIAPSDERLCESTELIFDGYASPIHYYTINGRQRTLSRDLKLSYYNLEWNEEQKNYIREETVRSLESVGSNLSLIPPVYCGTSFSLSGDRFLEEWNMGQSVESAPFTPVAVAVSTSAEQAGDSFGDGEQETGSNQIKTENAGLGGSAPAEITFYGYVTDAVRHTEWQMSYDPDFNDVAYRFTEQDLTYTFNEEGQYYLRFIGSNDDGSCEAFGDVYEVRIGASELKIPNAFSPDGDGVNDEWKVSYRSLTSFKCWIFDSKGQQLYYFDNPALGWDGQYRGRAVNPGVYYYVIEATGADGRKYKKGGDINILNCKKYGTGTGTTSPTE